MDKRQIAQQLLDVLAQNNMSVSDAQYILKLVSETLWQSAVISTSAKVSEQ